MIVSAPVRFVSPFHILGIYINALLFTSGGPMCQPEPLYLLKSVPTDASHVARAIHAPAGITNNNAWHCMTL